MDNIDSQKEYSFFNVGCLVSFISFEPINIATLPVNVILQLEPSRLVNLKNLEISKEKVIERLIANLGKEDVDTLTNSCKKISICIISTSFLGQGTEEEFTAELKH